MFLAWLSTNNMGYNDCMRRGVLQCWLPVRKYVDFGVSGCSRCILLRFNDKILPSQWNGAMLSYWTNNEHLHSTHNRHNLGNNDFLCDFVTAVHDEIIVDRLRNRANIKKNTQFSNGSFMTQNNNHFIYMAVIQRFVGHLSMLIFVYIYVIWILTLGTQYL